LKLLKLVMFLLVGGVLLGGLSCGKKGPPFLPQKTFNLSVVDLRGKCERDAVFLEGKIMDLSRAEKKAAMVKGARVYYVTYPLSDKPCEGCPLLFRAYREFGEEVASGENFLCRFPIHSRPKVYFFKVQLIGPEGTLGPRSGTLKIVVR